MANKTKIEWCDVTWNPVCGCLNSCPYCYAKKMNSRFHWIKNWNKPEWKQKNFDKKFPKKPSIIFVNSMSDFSQWDLKWLELVWRKAINNPQHVFLFLTKKINLQIDFDFKLNTWVGFTYTGGIDDRFKMIPDNKKQLFLSIEPLHYEPNLSILKKFSWIICGAESGKRSGKIIPQLEWIKKIVDYCRENKLPLFMKSNIKNVWEKALIQEFPIGLQM